MRASGAHQSQLARSGRISRGTGRFHSTCVHASRTAEKMTTGQSPVKMVKIEQFWQEVAGAMSGEPGREELPPIVTGTGETLVDQSELLWNSASQRQGGLEPLPTWVMGDEELPLTPQPEWTGMLLEGGAKVYAEHDNGQDWRLIKTDDVVLLSCNLSAADYTEDFELQAAVHDIYTKLALQVKASGWHVFRFWNFLPGINELRGTLEEDPVTTYMVFNYARNEALSVHYGSEDDMMSLVCTATGIGHTGPDFTVHAFIGRQEAIAVENPRQVPAYKYSRRWGPKPPSFSRGTIWPIPRSEDNMFIAGGTASVLGEDTAHLGDIREQTRETFRNMTSLLLAAGGIEDEEEAAEASKDWGKVPPYSNFTVYVRHMCDLEWVQSFIDANLTAPVSIDYKQATVCRRELLIEIEGVAKLDQNNKVIIPEVAEAPRQR